MNNLPCGYILQNECEFIADLAKGKSLCIDLGTCNGLSAALLSQGSERVITIDLFEDFTKIKNEGSRAHYKTVFESTPHYYADIKLLLSRYPNITVVQGFTYEYASTQNDNSVDIVFLDADHSFTGVQRDFEAWFPKVKKDGIFLFHDANHDGWEVKTFCDWMKKEFIDLVDEVDGIGSIRSFRKSI